MRRKRVGMILSVVLIVGALLGLLGGLPGSGLSLGLGVFAFVCFRLGMG